MKIGRQERVRHLKDLSVYRLSPNNLHGASKGFPMFSHIVMYKGSTVRSQSSSDHEKMRMHRGKVP